MLKSKKRDTRPLLMTDYSFMEEFPKSTYAKDVTDIIPENQ